MTAKNSSIRIIGLVAAWFAFTASGQDGSNLTIHESVADDQLMLNASSLLKESKSLVESSRQQLLQSNKIRRSLLEARRQPNEPTKAQADSLAEQLNNLQRQGNLLRQQASKKRSAAMEQFSKGLQYLWPQWVRTTQSFSASPLVDTTHSLNIQAHNTIERSVHPGMQGTTPTPTLADNASMSLMVNNAQTRNRPADLDTSIFQLSRNEHFIGHIEAAEFRQTDSHQIPLNRIHQWHLVLSNLQGEAIQDANIHFRGHMPGHVHGLPTQPIVDSEIAKGVYQVSGVKFQMQGWWVIDFEIKTDTASDVLRFNIVL